MAKKIFIPNVVSRAIEGACRDFSYAFLVRFTRLSTIMLSRTPPRDCGIHVATCGGTEEEGATRIRATERKLIIAAGQNWIRKPERGTRTPRGAIVTTSRCLVDTSKNRRCFSRGTAIFGWSVCSK